MEESKVTNMTSSMTVTGSRAGMWGKTIVCPHCNKVATVYHFSWSALSCQHCDTMIDKYDWKLL